MLDKGKDLDWFNSPAVVTLTVLAVIAFVAWIIGEAAAHDAALATMDNGAGI